MPSPFLRSCCPQGRTRARRRIVAPRATPTTAQSRVKEPPAGGVTAKKRLPLFWRWRRPKPEPIAGGGNARADGPRGGRGKRRQAGAEGEAHGGATGRASQRRQAGASPPADAKPEENHRREPLGHGEPKANRKAQAERLPLTEQKVRTFCGV